MQDYLSNDTRSASFGMKAGMLALGLHVAIAVIFYATGSAKPEKATNQEPVEQATSAKHTDKQTSAKPVKQVYKRP
jgi:hypothetical protein